jgi:hypothetical protein
MTMTAEQIRLKQNPVLTSLLLGVSQNSFAAQTLFPRLPQVLRGMTLIKAGDEHLRRYNLRRAPGSATKRVEISYGGQSYTVNQYSVEVPIPRELIQENENARRMNVGGNLDISRVAITTANAILQLDYELEASALATTAATFPAANVTALAGQAKWSADAGTPVSDIRGAVEAIRAAIGKRPNTLLLGAGVVNALLTNAEVRAYLPSTQLGPATLDQLKTILNVPDIVIGDAVYRDTNDAMNDVWGNNAVLAYVPRIGGSGADISLAEPAFGFTSVLEGNPFAEQPYYEDNLKSYVYGVTYERTAYVAYPEAGFLFQSPA